MKVPIPLAVTLALLTAQATMALAQGVEDYAPSPVVYEEYPYSIREDGTLIFEGDMVFACDDLPKLVGDPELPSARRAAEVCGGLGHLPSASNGELPDTGGIPASTVGISLTLAAGLVFAGNRVLRGLT